MTTVLRVKRRNDEEPLDALVIACKKRKTESGASYDCAGQTPLSAVVKFAGTLENQEDDVVEHLHRTLGKDELKANYKTHMIDVVDKTRLKTHEDSKANRYRVVNFNRSIDVATLDNKSDGIMTVIDVEDYVPCAAGDSSSLQQEVGYVYDVYFTTAADDMHLDEDLSIHLFENELVLDPYRENEVPDSCESEDSNSESNWKNDYPDSDHSVNSIDEEDMTEAVRKIKLDGEPSDLSDDDEEFVYAVDEADVDAHGYEWAKYKARLKAEDKNSDDSDQSEQS